MVSDQQVEAVRCRRAMPVNVAALATIDPRAWDSLVPPGSGGLRHGFLTAWERCELPGLTSRALTVPQPQGSGLMAAAAAYRFDLDLAAVQQLGPEWLLAAGRRIWPRMLVARVLELGAPVAAVDPLLLADGVDEREAAGAIIDAVLDDAAAAGAGFTIVQDHVPVPGPVAEVLRERGFAAQRTLPTAVLEHEFATFDDYLAAMRTKYRSRARDVLRQSAHLHCTRIHDFNGLAPEFAALWRLIDERATETRRETLGQAYFRAVARLADTSALVLRRADGSIAAFGLLLADPPWLHFLQCGFAAEAGRDEAAYFRLLLEVVRTGIDEGLRFVHLGCTTLGPKLAVGATPWPLHAWIHHRNGLINAACDVIGRRSRRAPVPGPYRVFAARRG